MMIMMMDEGHLKNPAKVGIHARYTMQVQTIGMC
jgi:hypothetical protein